MADQTLDQLPEETVPADTDLMYIVRDGLDRRIKRSTVVSGLVPATRTIATPSGNGLSGGGALSADRTLSVDISGLVEDVNPDINVDFVMTHDGSAGGLRKVQLSRISGNSQPNTFSSISVANQSSVIADTTADTLTLAQGANIEITTNPTTDTITIAATGLAPTSRSISAGTGLTGGGDLTANRSLSVNISGQSEDLTPDSQNDFVLVHKGASGVLRKMKLALLSGSSYTLPIASASTLGGIKLGAGLTADVNGVVSATTTYVLPAATTTTRGGVTVGAGLAVNATGVISNLNPTPYILPAATVGALGGVKAGQNVTISSDGTLDVASTGGGVSDGAYRPETYGAIRGTGLTSQQRQSNTTAINTCWSAAADAQSRVDMGGGTFEIEGTLVITKDSTCIYGDGCVIRQFGSGSIIALSTAVVLVSMRGLRLIYNAAQTVGDDPLTTETYTAALRLSGNSGCHFEDIHTTGAWVGIGVSGAQASFNNTFLACYINVLAGNGWGIIHKDGIGPSFISCRITGNGVVRTLQGGVYLANLVQVNFQNFNVELIQCRRAVFINNCQSVLFSGLEMVLIKPTPVGGFAGIVHATNGSGVQVAGMTLQVAQLDNTALGVTDCSIFTGELGANFLGTNIWISNTVKTGAVRFALLGHTSGSAARNVTGVFQQVRLDTRTDTPHRLDDINYATLDSASANLDGPLLSYNNVIGSATGGFFALADAPLTAWVGVHGRHLRLDAPLTVNRTITLSQFIDTTYVNGTLNSPRVPKGTLVEVTRTTAATGSFSLTVANFNAATLTTLALGSGAKFLFDGTNWTLLPGSVSAGGGSGGTFATQAEAEAGVSATVYMSPVRTRNAIDAYATANEVAGTVGQVVGFNSSNQATAIKNTRTMLVTIVPEDTANAAGVGIRKLMMPIGLQLTSITVYTPTTGTTGTTVDCNLGGTSILSAPITVAANTASTTVTTFVTGTMAKNTILTLDIDAAGTGSKGLQVAFCGVEV